MIRFISKKIIPITLALLLSGIPNVGAAIAAELVATEIVANVPNGVILLKQGETKDFTIKLEAIGNIDGLSTNPAVVTMDSQFNITANGAASLSGNEQYSFKKGDANVFYVTAHAAAAKDAKVGTYTININKTINNPSTSGGKLSDNTADQLTIKVEPSDTLPPTVAITAPVNGGFYSSANLPKLAYTVKDDQDPSPIITEPTLSTTEGQHTVTVYAKDASGNIGTTSVTYTIDNIAPKVSISSPTDGYYKTETLPKLEYSVDESNPFTTETSEYTTTEGEHTLTVTATDAAGNKGTATVNYTVDNTAPVVTITAPTAGFYQTDTLPELAYSVIDLTPHNETIDGYEKNEGHHTVNITSTDGAGNVGSASVDYIIDNTAPEILVNTQIDGRSFKSSELPTLEYSVKDNYDNNPVVTVPENLPNSEGTHTITISAIDKAGNTSSKDITYTVDNTPPQVMISNPVNGGNYKSSELPTPEYRAIDNLDMNPTITPGELPTTEGTHSFTVSATDFAGNVGSRTITYTIDDTAPAIDASNIDGKVLTLNQPVTWKATDSLSGIDKLTTGENNTNIVDTSSVGSKTLTLTATDNAGNITTKTVTYKVRYKVEGVLQPINNDGTSVFKLGSTIPVKILLKDYNGNLIENALIKPTLQYKYNCSSGLVVNEAVSTITGTVGSEFRWDASSQHYIFNLSTKTGFTSNTKYTLQLNYNDGSSNQDLVIIGIK